MLQADDGGRDSSEEAELMRADEDRRLVDAWIQVCPDVLPRCTQPPRTPKSVGGREENFDLTFRSNLYRLAILSRLICASLPRPHRSGTSFTRPAV